MADTTAQVQAIRDRLGTDAFRFTFTRSSGPGGQNVNKVASRVTLWFDLDGSTMLDEDEKDRIRTAYSGRVGADGRLRVSSMRYRTQAANRQACVERFFELLARALTPSKSRRQTRVSKAAKRRRVDQKRRKGEIKRLRQRDPGKND